MSIEARFQLSSAEILRAVADQMEEDPDSDDVADLIQAMRDGADALLLDVVRELVALK